MTHFHDGGRREGGREGPQWERMVTEAIALANEVFSSSTRGKAANTVLPFFLICLNFPFRETFFYSSKTKMGK